MVIHSYTPERGLTLVKGDKVVDGREERADRALLVFVGQRNDRCKDVFVIEPLECTSFEAPPALPAKILKKECVVQIGAMAEPNDVGILVISPFSLINNRATNSSSCRNQNVTDFWEREFGLIVIKEFIANVGVRISPERE